MRVELLEAVAATAGARRAQVLATALDGEPESRLLEPDADPDPLQAAAAVALRSDTAAVHDVDGRRWFLRPFNPEPRVIVVGAVHVAQALAALAPPAGFEVAVVDPRTAWATAERFPGVRLVHAWPDEAFSELGLDARTAVVTLTHDPKLDDPALVAALAAPVFYVGALGSRRTHARRVERLAIGGLAPSALERIRAPVGLDLGARTPGEIALAILAQILGALRT